MRLLISIFFVIIWFCGNTQNLDSLKKIAEKEDTTAIKANNLLYKEYIDSNPKKALQLTLKALDLALELNYKKGIATSYNNIGVFYKKHGIFNEAINYFLQSMQLNKEVNNATGYAYNLNNIGSIYSLKGQSKKALEYFLKSYWLLDSLNDQKNIVGALNNLGNTYLEMDEDYRAIGCYKKAIKVFDEIDYSNFNPYSNIGNVYLKRKETDRAHKYYTLSLQTSIDRKDTVNQALSYYNLSKLLLSKGNKKEALKLGLKALKTAKNITNKTLLKDIHLSLANLYYQNNNIVQAYNYRVLYDFYKDALINETSNKQLADLNATFYIVEKGKELALTKKENEVEKLKISNTKIIFIITIIMASIILLGGIFIYFSLKRNKKNNEPTPT